MPKDPTKLGGRKDINASDTMKALYTKVRAEQYGGRSNGQHAEERNAEHAIADNPDQTPFGNTRNVAHETRLYNKTPFKPHKDEAQPIRACDTSCKLQMYNKDNPGAEDLHLDVESTTYQKSLTQAATTGQKRKPERNIADFFSKQGESSKKGGGGGGGGHGGTAAAG